MPLNGKYATRQKNGVKKESEMMEMVSRERSQYTSIINSKRVRGTCSLTMAALFVISMILVVVGVSLIIVSSSKQRPCTLEHEEKLQFCSLSKEARRSGFAAVLMKIQKEYFRLHRHQSYHDPAMKYINDDSVMRGIYEPFNPRPSYLKKITDKAMEMLATLESLNVNENHLKLRERKALIQAKDYLKHIFGQPYDVNYYFGDWMLGPNHFCWQPICEVGKDIFFHLDYYQPHNLEDVKKLRKKLKEHRDAIYQYIANMKEGVKRGMVRSVEDCKVGVDAVKHAFLDISLHGESGVLSSWFMKFVVAPDFLKNITEKENMQWRSETGEYVNTSVSRYYVELVGKPIADFINYLEKNHSRHCIPSSVSNGLSDMPQDYIYLDGKRTEQKTNKTLPTGEVINSSKIYEHSLSYFTTMSLKPKQIYDLGYQQVEKLYPQVVEIAQNITGIANETEAVRKFREKLADRSNYFNDEPFPSNESDDNAHKRCSNIKDARKYCPKRWEAAEKWWAAARMAMSLIDSKTVNMFYFTGKKHTTPNCPVELLPDLIPSSGAQSYVESDSKCTNGAAYNIPFFLNNAGPRFSEWSVNAHEARPGHHTQVQGSIEHFKDYCDDTISWLHSTTYHTALIEGWALYAENPLVSETDIYDNNLMQKYGMLKWQIWRALRLILDSGIHTRSLTRQKALQLLDKYAWDSTDIARKEVTRYQSVFGQATAYTVGQLGITQLREAARQKLGKKFNLKDFHYQILSQGSAPLSYIAKHIGKYVQCVLQPLGDGCKYILSPPKTHDQHENHDDHRYVAGRLAKPSMPQLKRRHYV